MKAEETRVTTTAGLCRQTCKSSDVFERTDHALEDQRVRERSNAGRFKDGS